MLYHSLIPQPIVYPPPPAVVGPSTLRFLGATAKEDKTMIAVWGYTQTPSYGLTFVDIVNRVVVENMPTTANFYWGEFDVLGNFMYVNQQSSSPFNSTSIMKTNHGNSAIYPNDARSGVPRLTVHRSPTPNLYYRAFRQGFDGGAGQYATNFEMVSPQPTAPWAVFNPNPSNTLARGVEGDGPNKFVAMGTQFAVIAQGPTVRVFDLTQTPWVMTHQMNVLGQNCALVKVSNDRLVVVGAHNNTGSPIPVETYWALDASGVLTQLPVNNVGMMPSGVALNGNQRRQPFSGCYGLGANKDGLLSQSSYAVSTANYQRTINYYKVARDSMTRLVFSSYPTLSGFATATPTGDLAYIGGTYNDQVIFQNFSQTV